MISVGGIIGAGLFVGSSATIAAVGPAAVVSYAVAGATMLLVMLIIREMSGAGAGTGSFTELVRQGLGEGAGFVSGWLYWYFWVAVVPIEALAGATILHGFIPLPIWQIGLLLLTGMTAINLVSVRSFGEFEFWLSSIKVGGVVAFIAIAGAYASGLASPSGPTWANLFAHGGFAPMGLAAVLAGIPSAIFALTGAEIATLAAADSADPSRAVRRMTRSLAVRILLFYVVSLVLIVAIVPWRSVQPGVSPFAQALDVMHVPGGAIVMNFVVLTAVVSCLNSSLYITSRVLRTLASKGDAPRKLMRLSSRGVPARAVLASTLFGYLALFASVVSPQGVFSFLVNTSGAVMMFVYILLCLAQLQARRARSGSRSLAWASHAVIVVILAALAGMAATPALASQLYSSLLAATLAVGAFALRRHLRDRRLLSGIAPRRA
jgi:L-asparagine transporter-like permease